MTGSTLAQAVLWRLSLTVAQEHVPAFDAVLEGVCGAVSSFGDDDIPWVIEGYTDIAPDEDAIRDGIAMTARALGIDPPTLDIELLTPRDWLAENLATFAPLRIGRFFIHPSHYDDALPASSIPFCIDAGTAFGSGTHPTTETCLRAMIDLSKTYRAGRVLDMGCGSAILSLAAAKLWPARVLAVDIDPEAVTVSRRNIAANRARHRVRAMRGVGYRCDAIRRDAPFDIIVANVLARPLIKMADDAARALAPGGALVISGLLARDAAWVAAHHRARGLVLQRRYRLDDWATLVFRRPRS